ncbi:chromate efflux transporter [Phocicoccus pinnipedialis]|uniref:Chromate transport protein n=1 Tax=Phocicoccus pinnipedialis TaxID=110845 RepID=A0A6V7R3R7_9BACL|nr:chromate efflux transporter [Jeotgalicoccus pinnipedialis]MBP1940003.1 chromate transporter [Jeotgalicoccus pinnipedialis]CAD2072049.1 Chromate transport protein [Jeotgalicoccus pinnipedialis]
MKQLIQLFLVSLKLGVTSFGGPVAHLGYFHTEYVKRLKWMTEKDYMELVSLSQFLPGPASSQVGIGIGVKRAGIIGGITSFLGFTIPSVVLLMVFQSLLTQTIHLDGLITGLKLVAVAIVLHAIISMTKNFTTNWQTILIASISITLTLVVNTPFIHILVILLGAVVGFIIIKPEIKKTKTQVTHYISKKTGIISLIVFVAIFIMTPVLARLTENIYVQMLDSFYRAGSLVFGGGHVVLPLLEAELVPTYLDEATFLAGYGATQAVPGPLFTFASFLGAEIAGILGGLFATLVIFLPAFLLIVGMLPFWQHVMKNETLATSVAGINAAVVGILVSTWVTPIVETSVVGIVEAVIAFVLFVMIAVMKMPPWTVVLVGAVLGLLVGIVF